MLKYLLKSDEKLYDLARMELNRQNTSIEMIASESSVPIEIMELSGSIFTNKTLEGYPGKRFQTGSEVADEMEKLGILRAKELFGAEHVNLQPYSGSTANYSVYNAVLKAGDKILSLRLDLGGHLSHGSPANFISKLYDFHHYGLDKDDLIDYAEVNRLADEIRPQLIIAGGSAYPRLIDYKRLSEIALKYNAYLMCDIAHISGLVAADVIPSPVPYADFVTSSTTKTIAGPRSGMILCKEKYAKAIDKSVFPGVLGSIHLNTMAAKTWLFNHCKSEEFRDTMKQVVFNSKALAESLTNFGFKLVSGGTDTHLILLDLRNKDFNGKEFEQALSKVGINVNKNQVPNDDKSPFVTSGIRLGVTSITQRGFKEDEMDWLGEIFYKVSENITSEAELELIKEEVIEKIKSFPVYSPAIEKYILEE